MVNDVSISSFYTKCRCLAVYIFISMLLAIYLCPHAYAAKLGAIQYAQNPMYDSVPITPKTWEEVDFAYIVTIKEKQYTNTIQLFRPVQWFHARHMDRVGKIVVFSMPEFGVPHVRALVTAIKAIQLDTSGSSNTEQKTMPVIGIFKHYVALVRIYTFKNSEGQITHLKATPNHPIYVENKKAFVPLNQVTDTDRLVGMMNGHNGIVKMVCASHLHDHCGAPLKYTHIAAPVYNLEIYKRHRYRVGRGKVIVHNYCSNPEVRARSAWVIQKAWRSYRKKAYDAAFRVSEQALQLGGEEIQNLEDLRFGDVFVRARQYQAPTSGHSGIYKVIWNATNYDYLSMQSIDVVTNPYGLALYGWFIRTNANYHPYGNYLSVGFEEIFDAHRWFRNGVVHRIRVPDNVLIDAVFAESKAARPRTVMRHFIWSTPATSRLVHLG